MSESQVKSLVDDKSGQSLKYQLFVEPEMESIQKKVNGHIKEVETLAKENEQIRSEMQEALNQYNER